MTISTILAEREITEVLHFTTNKGLVGSLAERYLMSRYLLPASKYLQHVLHVNSAIRPEEAAYFDKSQNWLDYVNLSISEINRRFFDVSLRRHKDADIWWAILSFDAEIMTHEGVFFATTNNSYDDECLRAGGVAGLNALFGSRIARKPTWSVNRLNRAANLPTCEQAEVLYPSKVSLEWLRKIYVIDGEHHDAVCAWLKEFELASVEVLISPEKFVGKHN